MKTLYTTLLFITLLLSASLAFGQQTERENGIALFNKGSYKEAAKLLEKAVKTAPADAEARTYLGLAELKLGKLKDAEKTLGKSLQLNPNQPNAQKALGYTLLLRNKPKDSLKQMEALKAANSLDAESYYIIGWANMRLGNNETALENAEQSVKLNPKFANAYLLKAYAIMNHWNEPKDYKQIAAKYGSSADNIGKYITLSSELPDASFWRGQQETLRVFADYYNEREKNKNSADETSTNITPLKIVAKPRAMYTDRARQAGVMGAIRLLAAFGANGKIEHVLVLTSLGYGLDEEAVKAARNIQFEPETRDGKPVMSVKTIEYSFMIY